MTNHMAELIIAACSFGTFGFAGGVVYAWRKATGIPWSGMTRSELRARGRAKRAQIGQISVMFVIALVVMGIALIKRLIE